MEGAIDTSEIHVETRKRSPSGSSNISESGNDKTDNSLNSRTLLVASQGGHTPRTSRKSLQSVEEVKLDLLRNVEFLAPTEGTPAALALAGNDYEYMMVLELHRTDDNCKFLKQMRL